MTEEDHLVVLANELNRVRVAKEWKIEALARTCQRSRTSVSQALNARSGRPIPSMATIVSICNALGVDDQPYLDLLRQGRMRPHPMGVEPQKTRRGSSSSRRSSGLRGTAGDLPYNPLDLANLTHSVQWTLEAIPPTTLAEDAFPDADGIYAIYYTGAHRLYQLASSPECVVPLYLGTARMSRSSNSHTARGGLRLRLSSHRQSIEQCENLSIADFMVRALPAVEVFLAGAERLMLAERLPVWNVSVSGFGNHPAGRERRIAARSEWDELHPGRSWAGQMRPSRRSASQLEEIIREHFRAYASGPESGR